MVEEESSGVREPVVEYRIAVESAEQLLLEEEVRTFSPGASMEQEELL